MSGRRKASRPGQSIDLDAGGFVRSVQLVPERVPSFERYPYSIPAVRRLAELSLHPRVTFLIGENGSGKSTLIEAIAIAAGFNAEGGTKNFRFATRRSESELHAALRLVRGTRRERDGFFLRAESLYNVATEIERLNKDPFSPPLLPSYGGASLHDQSHGESFLALATHRFGGDGLYILDEPEAALSPRRQLALLKLLDVLVRHKRSQFVITTHSPILMAYPDALIYLLSADGITAVAYEATEHYQVTRDFLANRELYLHHLLSDDD